MDGKKQYLRNKSIKTSYKNKIKKFMLELNQDKVVDILLLQTLLNETKSFIGVACRKNVIKQNKRDRLISRIDKCFASKQHDAGTR